MPERAWMRFLPDELRAQAARDMAELTEVRLRAGRPAQLVAGKRRWFTENAVSPEQLRAIAVGMMEYSYYAREGELSQPRGRERRVFGLRRRIPAFQHRQSLHSHCERAARMRKGDLKPHPGKRPRLQRADSIAARHGEDDAAARSGALAFHAELHRGHCGRAQRNCGDAERRTVARRGPRRGRNRRLPQASGDGISDSQHGAGDSDCGRARRQARSRSGVRGGAAGRSGNRERARAGFERSYARLSRGTSARRDV